jgi:hypothetical protein
LTFQEAEQLEEAISAFDDAVTIFRETGDRHGEGVVLEGIRSASAEQQG